MQAFISNTCCHYSQQC